MAGAVSFILIVCLRRVLAFDVLNLGTAISKPHSFKYKIDTTAFILTKTPLRVNLKFCNFTFLTNLSAPHIQTPQVQGNFFFRASATWGGTIKETSPWNDASSFIDDERSTMYLGSVLIKRVSIWGFRALFIMDSSNS